MTVADLIEKLRELPQDAIVMHTTVEQYGYAGEGVLQPDNITFDDNKVWLL